MIPLLVFGRKTSEVYARIRFFRDVAGYWEDKNIIMMVGPGKHVEGDGMFTIGKRKGLEDSTAKSIFMYVLKGEAEKYVVSS